MNVERTNELSQGQRVGNFILVRRVSDDGGMSQLWEARHAVLDEPPVALKILDPRIYGGAAGEQRFASEALAPRRVEHPGVVQIRDAGQDAQVGFFLVMELLAGQTLEAAIAAAPDERLSLNEGLPIGVRLAEILERVHAAGVVHRDLKPGNVFLTGDPQRRVVVIDFGLARDPKAQARTSAHFQAGTPGFSAPEQALGPLADVGTPADIFAFGRILFAMFGPTDKLSSPLANLIEQCTRPDPGRRPTAQEVVGALSTIAVGYARTEVSPLVSPPKLPSQPEPQPEPPVPRIVAEPAPETLPPTGATRTRRHRFAIKLIGAIAVASIIALAVALARRTPEPLPHTPHRTSVPVHVTCPSLARYVGADAEPPVPRTSLSTLLRLAPGTHNLECWATPTGGVLARDSVDVPDNGRDVHTSLTERHHRSFPLQVEVPDGWRSTPDAVTLRVWGDSEARLDDFSEVRLTLADPPRDGASIRINPPCFRAHDVYCVTDRDDVTTVRNRQRRAVPPPPSALRCDYDFMSASAAVARAESALCRCVPTPPTVNFGTGVGPEGVLILGGIDAPSFEVSSCVRRALEAVQVGCAGSGNISYYAHVERTESRCSVGGHPRH